MFFKKTAENLNKTVRDVNKVIKEVGKSSTKLLDNSNDAVTDFNNNTKIIIWTVIGCVGFTMLTNAILLGVGIKLTRSLKLLSPAAATAATETIKIVLGGK